MIRTGVVEVNESERHGACHVAPRGTTCQPRVPTWHPRGTTRERRYGLGLILYRAPCAIKGVLRYQANPKESHLVAIKRMFRYLKGTPNLGLWYPKGSGFDLKAYSGSDYAGCNLDRNSTSGGCQILGGKLVCWSAKKQSSVPMSSAEAEYVAAVGCCAQVLWIKSQLDDYDVLYDNVPIFCDNTSVIAILNNLVLHSRTKHIDIRYHFIRVYILKSDIELHFVPTELQLADIFTNPLAEPSFTILVAELGMLNIEKQVSDKKKALSDL
ncbi:hypothetical protein Tco_1301402 [Tanacetum coccineum]